MSKSVVSNCDCSTSEDFCDWGSSCYSGYFICETTSSGCGWVWFSSCNGFCAKRQDDEIEEKF